MHYIVLVCKGIRGLLIHFAIPCQQIAHLKQKGIANKSVHTHTHTHTNVHRFVRQLVKFKDETG